MVRRRRRREKFTEPYHLEEGEVVINVITKARATTWYSFFENELADTPFHLLIKEPAIRSDTVIAVESSESDIKAIKAATQQAGITLGNGYGDWKNTTFRIANFPAITDSEIDALKEFLRTYVRQ